MESCPNDLGRLMRRPSDLVLRELLGARIFEREFESVSSPDLATRDGGFANVSRPHF